MFKRALIAILVFSSYFVSAQDSLRVYYNSDGHFTTPQSAYSFCDFLKVKDSIGWYTGAEYYITGHLKSAGIYVTDGYDFLRTGRFTEYFPDRNKKSEGAYVANVLQMVSLKTGKWKYYYPNGKLMTEWIYQVDSSITTNENILMSFWDTAGTQRVLKGNGYYFHTISVNVGDSIQQVVFSGKILKGKYDSTWVAFDENGKLYATEEYKNGMLIHGKSSGEGGKEYSYDSVEIAPAFPGGDMQMMRFLQKNVQYPVPERDNDIQGKIVVGFIVRWDGSVIDVKVLRGVSEGLDKESVRVVKLFPKFIPGKQRGQPVSVYYSVPIIFKLQ